MIRAADIARQQRRPEQHLDVNCGTSRPPVINDEIMYTRWNNAPHWLRKTNKKAVMWRGNPSVVCRLRKWLHAWFVRATCVGDSKE